MGCSFNKDELDTKGALFEKGDKIVGRLSKRLRNINSRSEMEENDGSITENVKRIEGE